VRNTRSWPGNRVGDFGDIAGRMRLVTFGSWTSVRDSASVRQNVANVMRSPIFLGSRPDNGKVRRNLVEQAKEFSDDARVPFEMNLALPECRQRVDPS